MSGPHLTADLRCLLDAYVPASDDSAAALAQLHDLLRHAPDPCGRTQFTPGHVTVSMLLLNPAGTHLAPLWHEKLQRTLQPGGHAEPGDATLLSAALRELTEETGVPAGAVTLRSELIDLDVHVIPARKNEPEPTHYDLRFGAQLRQDWPGVTWTPLAELTDPSVRRAAAALATRTGLTAPRRAEETP